MCTKYVKYVFILRVLSRLFNDGKVESLCLHKKVTFVLRNFESWTFLKTELIHLRAGIKTSNLLTYHDLSILLVLINGNHFWNEQTAMNSPCEQTCVLGDGHECSILM